MEQFCSVEIEVGGGGSFEEKFLEESDRKKPPPAVDEVSKEVLVPIDNELDTKDHSPPSSSSTVKSYFNLRRKSNRILRKSNHVSQNIISSSNEDSTVTVVEIDSTVNGENVKKEVSTSDVSSTSTVASSSATTNKPVSAGKSLRKFQAWTEDDIRWFFEALCEVTLFRCRFVVFISLTILLARKRFSTHSILHCISM